MPIDPAPGDIVYAGYPTAHVWNVQRASNGDLSLRRIKHLLWGDWTRVSDYDFVASGDGEKLRPALRADEEATARQLVAGLVPVRVRGADGYMHPADLQDEHLLEVVFVDVGQGDGAVLVTPDDKTFVIDAGIADNMYRYLAWRFRDFGQRDEDFDGLIITHPDADHYLGFERLLKNPEVRAKTVWHNGLMERFKLSEGGAQSDAERDRLGPREPEGRQDYLVDLMQTDAGLATFLDETRNWVNDRTGEPKLYAELLAWAQSARDGADRRRFPQIAMLSTRHGEIVDGRSYLPGYAPQGPSGCVIEVLGPVVEPDAQGRARVRVFAEAPAEKTKSMDVGKTKNGHSVLLKLTYRGFSLLFGGDLNSSAETFLLQHYTGLKLFGASAAEPQEVREAARPFFGVDMVKACHHGSADFTDLFMGTTAPLATVVSSGDEESHAHPRCDTLGAIGHFGRGARPLVFSTELSRSTREFTRRDDTPWYRAAQLEGKAEREDDPAEKQRLLDAAKKLWDQQRTTNVTVYGSINLRTDGRRVVLAYMLEEPSATRRWDVYTMEQGQDGSFEYVPVKVAQEREAKRREAAEG